MGDSRIPQDLQQLRRGIGLHRIHRLARKLLGEESGGTRGGVRAVADHGFVRREGADYSLGVRMMVQLKGPPTKQSDTSCLAVGSPHGAAETRAYMPLPLNCK